MADMERDALAVRSGELRERMRIRGSLTWVLIDMFKLTQDHVKLTQDHPHRAHIDLGNLFSLIRERCFDEIERSEAGDG